jgi:hypothetical protein
MNANRGCRGRFCPFFAAAAAGFLPLYTQIQQLPVLDDFYVFFLQKSPKTDNENALNKHVGVLLRINKHVVSRVYWRQSIV